MDPQVLIGPASPLGSPVPYWLMIALKVLGFTLHMVPMHLWLVGIVVALIMRAQRVEHARQLGARLLQQMPLIIAAGVNLGIVPLLFLQVSYYRAFYPATILMAWPWLAIIAMLMVAYYGVYLYVVGLRGGGISRVHIWAGWIAAVFFLCIGFVFSSALSLMARVDRWGAIWDATSVDAAPLGTWLFVDSAVVTRWLMMLGLALTTLAAYILLDTALFAGKESRSYRVWASGFAFPVFFLGIAWYGLAGLWYVLGTWPLQLREHLLSGPNLILVVVTAISPAVPLMLVLLQRAGAKPVLALLTAAAQLGVLALQAISRQVKQNIQLAPYFSPAAEQPNVQWDVLILFLVLFVGGVVLISWMVSKAARAHVQEVRVSPNPD